MIQGVVLLIAFVAIVAGFVLYFSSETLVASRAGRLAMLLGVALLPGAALLGGASYAYQASSTTEFCLSCHEMDAHGQSLFVDDPTVLPAVHYQKRLIDRDHACFVCHTDYAMFGDLEAKMNGLKHVWVHYLGEASDPLDLYSPYPNANCLHCHDDARSFLEASVQEDGEIPTNCARCHSREGFRDYIGDDASEVGVVNQAAPIGSVVDCDTCHNDAAGSLDWVTFPSGVSVDELGAEARCMTCHQGRGSTDSVDALIMQAGVADDEVSDVLTFQNIHYFPVAATLFAGVARGGYQYEEQVYDRRFRHVPEYNSCTDCHDPHTTQPRFDGCATCHSAVTSAAEVRDIRMIASRNVDYDGDGDTEVGIYYEIEGLKEKHQMARKDPGAYVHNGRYIIKLLHDSIEDLNGVISMPVDMSAADRDAPGHFNGASDAARHWDEDEAVAASCSKCHSGATGFRFLTEFGVGVEVPEPANGLECYTCHDNFGNSYDVIEVESTVYSGGAEAEHDGFDNICATCRSGRQSGATVDAAIAAGQLGFRNVHYLPAAGIRNGNETGVGYEYPARDYAGFLQHDSRTQCAGCHDPVESNHTFRIADVWSGICDGCHSDQDGADEIRMVHLDDYDGDGAAPHSRLAIADIWHRPPGTSSCRLEDARTGARHVCGFVTISRTTCLPGWSCSWSRCRCASGLRSPPGHRSSLA